MIKHLLCLSALLLGLGALAGCSSSSSQDRTSITGKVADGYLVNAVVFLDKNKNYQLDSGEPNTTTGSDGSFSLTIDPADAGKYPLVVLAIKDQTIDLDTSQAVTSTYVLSMHALSVTPGSASAGTLSGTVSNFISPVSTLIRETIEANPGMTVADAITQVRNQLNLPTGMDIRKDYVFGSYSTNDRTHHRDFKNLHQAAQTMAGMMAGNADLVMNGRAPHQERYREMVGQLSGNLPHIADSLAQQNYSSATLRVIRTELRNAVGALPATDLHTLTQPPVFPRYTSLMGFWNMSGGRMKPRPHGGR